MTRNGEAPFLLVRPAASEDATNDSLVRLSVLRKSSLWFGMVRHRSLGGSAAHTTPADRSRSR